MYQLLLYENNRFIGQYKHLGCPNVGDILYRPHAASDDPGYPTRFDIYKVHKREFVLPDGNYDMTSTVVRLQLIHIKLEPIRPDSVYSSTETGNTGQFINYDHNPTFGKDSKI